uniref:DUF569 domain-containing protein n=1 Tax=Ananas comosus var. bracteatus TaxID=296719 RepID=A0A6V7NWD8_ANACO|nr:unnamed protein product [Ananas comosus var. bracteatus]
MELFERAKTVRLRSHHGKYLHVNEDEQHVRQDRDAVSPNARWSVDPVPPPAGQDARFICLRGVSCRYLTASNEPFLLAAVGRKVVQTAPARRLDSSVEWEPLPAAAAALPPAPCVRVRTRYSNFLRANAGLPPGATPSRTSSPTAIARGCRRRSGSSSPAPGPTR